jgi:hypothetical protein
MCASGAVGGTADRHRFPCSSRRVRSERGTSVITVAPPCESEHRPDLKSARWRGCACRCSPQRCHTLATESLLTPRCSASNRADQCITPSRSGGGSSVACTIAGSSTVRGRPGFGRSSSPGARCANPAGIADDRNQRINSARPPAARPPRKSTTHIIVPELASPAATHRLPVQQSRPQRNLRS